MFSWLNDKRKGLYLQSCIFINLFYKIHDFIYLIKIYSISILIFWIFIMIDYTISDPKKKFELIWSCILKVMIFTILGFFLNLFNCIFGFKLIKKNKKGFYITARWRGRVKPRDDAWLCVCVTREHECVRDTHVCAWYVCEIINGLGAPVIGFKLTHKSVAYYKPE